MLQELQKMSETCMQDLLQIEMLQQIIERIQQNSAKPITCSPYFLEGHQAPSKHLAIAKRLRSQQSKSKNKVMLHPKSDDELKRCLEIIQKQATKVVAGEIPECSNEVLQAAKNSLLSNSNVDQLIIFAKLYYDSYLDALLGKA